MKNPFLYKIYSIERDQYLCTDNFGLTFYYSDDSKDIGIIEFKTKKGANDFIKEKGLIKHLTI